MCCRFPRILHKKTHSGCRRVVDYVNNREYGTVEGPTAKLSADFQGNLLLEATQKAQ
jgi:hypothetical protein